MVLMLNVPPEIEEKLKEEAERRGLEAEEYALQLIERQLSSQNLPRAEILARIFEDMENGLELGGPPYPTREEIYEERLERFG